MGSSSADVRLAATVQVSSTLTLTLTLTPTLTLALALTAVQVGATAAEAEAAAAAGRDLGGVQIEMGAELAISAAEIVMDDEAMARVGGPG